MVREREFYHSYFSLIFQHFRLQDGSYCDSHRNCLPSVFGYSVPLISYAITFLLFLLFSLDSLQPDTIQEIIQVVTFALTNLAVRVITFVLSLAFLGNKTCNLRELKSKLDYQNISN